MTQTIVILLQVVVTDRYVERLGAAALRDKYDVRIFDLTPWLKPAFWRRYQENRYRGNEYQAIFDFDQFRRELSTVNNGLVFDYLESGRVQNEIRAILKLRGMPRAKVVFGLLPIPHQPSTRARLRAALSWQLPWRLWKKLTDRNHGTCPALDVVFDTGEAGLNIVPDPVPHRIAAHGPDYDEFLQLDRQRNSGAQYAVYLDEDMLHHPDYEYARLPVPVSGERFYSRLNAFFEAFEARAGMPVRIAAHPRSRYDERPHLLPGREQLRGETARLVRDASIVFAHCSTALSFVSLWRKPVVFLSSDEIGRSWMQPAISKRVEIFNAPLINLDRFSSKDIDLPRWMLVNDRACAEYVRQFVKMPGSPEKPLWTIVSDYIARNPSLAAA